MERPVGATDGVQTALIECPIAKSPEGHCAQHLADLSSRHARILGRVMTGLKTDGQKLANGKTVTSANDAVVWILEKIATETIEP